MARDISIAISAKDNFSQAITTMKNANQGFNKDLTGLQTKLNELNKTKITLKVDTDKARTELKEAEKQFAKTGEAADKLKLEMANANYENARRNMSLLSDNAKQAEKDIRSLTNTVSKSENRAGSTGTKSSASSIVSSLAASGAVGLVGNVVSDIATTYIGSAYGGEAGTLADSTLSTGAMGAAIGAAFGPGGAVAGAIGGALLGYLQGQNKIFENKDEAFKSYYEDAYNDAQNTQSQSLTNGIEIASARESDRISFSTVLKGDKNANKFLGDLTKFANKTPFEYDDLTKISTTLLAYGYKQNEIIPLLTKVGDTGSALGKTTDDMTWIATSLGRMQTTGKTTMEYLDPLLQRGIHVWDYLAEASGKTKNEVVEMVSKGLVPGAQAAKAIADYMGAEYAGNMDKQSKTYSGLVSTLKDAQAGLDKSMGEGYTSVKSGGLKEQTDWLSGESGKGMKYAYNKIGQWKASLENLSDQYKRDALNSVMTGDIATSYDNSDQKEALEGLAQDYAKAKKDYNKNLKLGNKDKAQEAGAEMGRVLAEAQVIATNEYNASEGAQVAIESNKTLANNIKNDSASQDAYWDAGYSMAQQFTLGLASGMKSDVEEGSPEYVRKFTASNNGTSTDFTPNYLNKGLKQYAYGLNYVPYDNYPALLHEGEKVLTASENRSRGTNTPINTPINVNVNSLTVRQESDVKAVAQEVASLIKRAYILAP